MKCKSPKCNKEIPPERSKRHPAKYCSDSCRRYANRKTSGYIFPKVKIPTATTGAIGELAVCAHLLKKGFEVFRAVSPACSCDLVLLHKGKPFRVEVRFIHQTYQGKIPPLYQKDKGKSDIVAWVFYNKTVYDPPLKCLETHSKL